MYNRIYVIDTALKIKSFLDDFFLLVLILFVFFFLIICKGKTIWMAKHLCIYKGIGGNAFRTISSESALGYRTSHHGNQYLQRTIFRVDWRCEVIIIWHGIIQAHNSEKLSFIFWLGNWEDKVIKKKKSSSNSSVIMASLWCSMFLVQTPQVTPPLFTYKTMKKNNTILDYFFSPIFMDSRFVKWNFLVTEP